MSEHCVVFDKVYPNDRIIEALGVHYAAATGACEDCGHLPECSANSGFEFPADAACMMKAREYSGENDYQ